MHPAPYTLPPCLPACLLLPATACRAARPPRCEIRLEVPASSLAAVEKCFEYFYYGFLDTLEQADLLDALMFGDRLQVNTQPRAPDTCS